MNFREYLKLQNIEVNGYPLKLIFDEK